ncbi:MAG: FAD:protein FMN transferase [Clostridia bacterium]|nr:FAD:protein FMN transferase [Clostridia bacterium]
MKKLCASLCAILSGLILLSGCNTKTYNVYSNIPHDWTKPSLKNYILKEDVLSVQPNMPEAKFVLEGNYKSVGKTFYNIMTSDANIVISDDFTNKAQAEQKFSSFLADAEQILKGAEGSLSISVEGSAVYNFNNADAGATIKIDKTAYEVLDIALNMHEFTQGYYNPAIYYNVEMYGFHEDAKKPQAKSELPSDEKVQAFAELSSHFSEVKLIEDDGEYYVKKPSAVCTFEGQTYSMKLDLGGIGKGYCADLISALMDSYGYEYGYFDFGSSSMVCKNHYKQGDYKIGFRDPRSKSAQAYFEVFVNNKAVSTSADDVKYYEIDGVRYCHIFNPTTGKPVDSEIMSASIAGLSAAKGDALTTAIMAMGKQKAVEFVNTKLNDAIVVFCCDE